jgi:hypothetical protein
MGRAKKYNTEEERIAANREASRKWYYDNINNPKARKCCFKYEKCEDLIRNTGGSYCQYHAQVMFKANKYKITPAEKKIESIRKEIEYLIDDFFNNNDCDFFDATSKDIKERFFDKNNQISINYIFKILKTEMKLEQQKMKRYYPFNEITLNSKSGQPFLFTREKIKVSDKKIDKYHTEGDEEGDEE